MRKRPIKISLRLNEQEHEHLKQQAALSGFPMEQFLRGLIADEKMRPRPPNEYAEIRRQLAAIGNNINQIAVRVNSTNAVYLEDLKQIEDGMERIWQQLKYFQSQLQCIKP